MSYDTPVAPTLFNLIAREWSLGFPVESLAFNHDLTALAFAGPAGLALVPIADPERPESRIRVAADTGRPTIHPRQSPVRPATRLDKLAGPVAAFGARSFPAVAASGGLVSVTPRGQDVPLTTGLTGAATALARDPTGGTLAVAEGARVALLDEDMAPRIFDAGVPVTALAFAPRGGALAVAGGEGVTIWRDGACIASHDLAAAPVLLDWSPDGAHLVCGFAGPGFALIGRGGGVAWRRDYPTPVASFGWGPGFLVTSGAFRITAWDIGPEGLGDPAPVGKPGLVVVDRVTAAPDRPLVAAAYAGGLVCVARPGTRDEMALRTEGAPVRALAWSPDGAHLALGCADGTAALVTFPPNMFK